MGKIIWICSSWKTKSNSVKEVGLKKVNERYLSVISFVLFIETKGSPPRTTQCQSLVKERKIILFLKQLQGYGSSKPIFILFYPFVLLFFFDSHITCTLVSPWGLKFVPRRCLLNKQRSLDCALFCCKARRKRLEHERSVGGNTRRSRVFLPTS